VKDAARENDHLRESAAADSRRSRLAT